MFEDINSRSILKRVPVQLEDEKARSLWRYLKAQFDEIRASIREAMSEVTDSTRGSNT